MIPLIKKTVDYAIWVLFFVFSTFSLLFYITKDTVPGDRLFGMKIGVEKVIIALSPLLAKHVDAQIKFVHRRFNETALVLNSKHGAESLIRLDAQVVDTADAVANIKDPVKRKEAASKFYDELAYISAGLREEKKKILSKLPEDAYIEPDIQPNNNNVSEPAYNDEPDVYTEPSVPSPSTPIQVINREQEYYQPSPTVKPAVTFDTPPTLNELTNQQLTEQIDQTQQTIEETIEKMIEIQEKAATPKPTEIPTPLIGEPTERPSTPYQQPTSLFRRITTPTITLTPILYVCSPGSGPQSEGRCEAYDNPYLSQCPKVYPNDPACAYECGIKEYRCKNASGKNKPSP